VTALSHSDFFPHLSALPGIAHGFIRRIPGIDAAADRETALHRLESAHAHIRTRLGLDAHFLITAAQVHGAGVAIVDAATTAPVADVDGLITTDPRACLCIHVADCGPVFIIEPRRRVIALLHSGRRGTELGITTAAIERMKTQFHADPAAMVLQLGPCIRPPLYETDFAAAILGQARAAGIRHVHDCGICTGASVDSYYSYRVEKGRTGRMAALLALIGA
jgi:hypothetical protein